MSQLLTDYSKTINLNKQNYTVINIPHNLLKRTISYQPPNLEHVDTFTIMWDNIHPQTFECKINTVINWILIKNNLSLMYSQVFLDKCLFDENLLISEKNNDIFTVLKEPGTYFFSTNTLPNCKEKYLIFIVK